MYSDRVQKARATALVVLPLVGVAIAMVLLWNRYIFPLDLLLLGVFYALTVMGITVGFHRMLTHQGFETHPWVKGFFLILGCMAFEGSPNDWASTHIKHHAHSDKKGDPHSPLEGFWHSHFGWLFHRSNFADVKEYAPHLLEDPVVQFVNKYTPLWMALSLLIPGLIGGWSGFIWGGLVRIFLVNHVTWSVNSICHCFGARPFEVHDESRNEWVVGLLAFGEGWHNNHHAFPSSAFHGLKWWQFDLSGLTIRGMEKMGLIWNVERVSAEAIEQKERKAEGMREALAELKEQLCVNIASAKEDLAAFYVRTIKKAPIPVQASLFEQKKEVSPARKKLQQAHDEAAKRLEEMRCTLARRRSLRKQHLQEYKEEIKELVAAAKKRMQQEVKKRVVTTA